MLRTTDRSVADICLSVGLVSVGSFTTSFTRTYRVSPTAYRPRYPPASADVTLPELGDFRWLTVAPPGQPDVSIVLGDLPDHRRLPSLL